MRTTRTYGSQLFRPLYTAGRARIVKAWCFYRVRRLTKNKSYQDKAQDIQGGMIHFLVLAFARHGLSQKIVSLELRIEDPEINSKPSTPKP